MFVLTYKLDKCKAPNFPVRFLIGLPLKLVCMKGFWAGLLSIIFCGMQAQTITIKDQVSLQPIEGVRIADNKNNIIRFTNARGEADVKGLANSSNIEVRYYGYVTLNLSFAELTGGEREIFLAPGNLDLDEIVVSANRWEQSKSKVPNKITTIKAREIAFQNPQTAADLLGTSGEVYIQKSQLGGGSPMIRGFSTNRILLVVDGVRMNNAIFRSGNLQNVISLDPNAMQSAEVVFGPGSLIYGSDAIGGVMDFHTLDASLSPNDSLLLQVNALTRYSSANQEKTAHADVNFGFEKWAFLSSITYTDYEDQRMGSNGPDEYLRPVYATRQNGIDVQVPNPDPEVQTPSGYSQMNLMQKVHFRPNKFWSFKADFHYSATSDVPRYDRLIRYRGDQLRSAEWYYGPQVWWMNRLEIEHHASNALYDHARLILAYQFFEESRHDRDFGDPIRNNSTEQVNAYTANLDFDKGFGDRLGLYYGAEVVLNEVGSTAFAENIESGEQTPIGTRYPDGANWNSYAAYANLKADLTEKLTWNTGLRLNLVDLSASFDTTFYPLPFTRTSLTTGAVTAATGFSYRPQESWMIKFNVSTGFRAPNIDDIGKVFDSGDRQVVIPNPGLKPEQAYNFELGVAKVVSQALKLDVSAYYTYLDDALVRRNFTLNGMDSIDYRGETSRVQAIQNASSAYVYGFQAGINARLPYNLNAELRYNYQFGEEELDNGTTAPLRHAAPWFGLARLTYTIKKFKADFYAVYNGEVSNAGLAPTEQDKPWMYATDENGNPYSPAWYTLNFKTSYQFTPYLQLNLGVENITDQRYRPYSSGIVAPGINFIGALRASF